MEFTITVHVLMLIVSFLVIAIVIHHLIKA